MALEPGTRIGAYQVVGPLGAGGMGEVYRARDTALGRAVAIKVLPPEFAGDGERLGRFEREARLLASLNHPNIAAILPDSRALVLELVEGQGLDAQIGNRGLRIAEACDVGAPADLDLWHVPLDGGMPARTGLLTRSGWREAFEGARAQVGTWSATGVLLAQAGLLWAVPLNVTTGTPGTAQRLIFGAVAVRRVWRR